MFPMLKPPTVSHAMLGCSSSKTIHPGFQLRGRGRWLQDTLGSSPEALLFADEMVASINRVNYNQDNSLNAMAGMSEPRLKATTHCSAPQQTGCLLA